MSYLGVPPNYQTAVGFRYTISGTTSSITGADDNGKALSYTVAFVWVYHNGVKLVDTLDYTATNGSSITLLNAAIAGDTIEVVAFGVYSLLNGVPALTDAVQSFSNTQQLTAASNLNNTERAIGTVDNFSISCSAASNNLTITINDALGNAPSNASKINGNFRSSTLTTGTTVNRQSNSAITFTINDTNTMGTTTNKPFRLHLYLFDNSGTMVLGAIGSLDISTGYPLIYKPEIGALQTSASGTNGGSTAHTFYASVSALTSKAIAYLGFVECDSISFTAGKWGSSGTGLITRVVKWYPGMPMPGDVVNSRHLTETAQPSTTSSTMQNTSTLITYAAQSKCSVIHVYASGVGSIAGTGSRFICRLHADAAAFGSSADIYTNAGGSITLSSMSLVGTALPASTSSVTYRVKFSNTDNATTAQWNAAQVASASITLYEISI